jgi:hypothetical protein
VTRARRTRGVYAVQLAKGAGRQPWFFRIVNINDPAGQPIATSEGYLTRFNRDRQARKLTLPLIEDTPAVT